MTADATYDHHGDNILGVDVSVVDTTPRFPLGYITRVVSKTWGAGEAIYLKGATSIYAGVWVTYNMDDGTVTKLTAGAKGPVAIAEARIDAATKYGWFMIQGKAVGRSGTVADDADVYLHATCDGKVDDSVTVNRVFNAKFASANDTTTGLAEMEIARPFLTQSTS